MGSGYERRVVPLWQTVVICIVVALLAGLVVYGGVALAGTPAGSDEEQTAVSSQTVYVPETGDTVSVGQTVSPSVVFISNIVNSNSLSSLISYGSTSGSDSVVSSTGSGVIYSADGYIITNNHVVSGADRISVQLYDGTEYEATVIGMDSRTDLAVIKIEAEGLTAATFGDSSALVTGELAVAIGNPGGKNFKNSLTQGVISGLDRYLRTQGGELIPLIQTDAAINPGNSGGALCNGAGEVVGINTIKVTISGYEGMGFAIPSNTALEICNQLIENGKVLRPGLQVGIYGNVTAQVAAYYQLGVDYGVLISPAAGGAAATAGLEDYDIIIAIDDQQIEDYSSLQDYVFSKEIGDTVKVTVRRGDQTLDFDVTLGELE